LNSNNASYAIANTANEDRLSQAIWISIGLHIAAVAVFTLRAVLYPSQAIEMEHTIHIDMVGLPTKIQSLPIAPPLEKAPPVEAPKIEAAPAPPPVVEKKLPPLVKPQTLPETPKVNLNQVKHQQESALKRIEAMQRIEHLARTQPTRSSAPIRGNQVSPGKSLTGLARLENAKYTDGIDEFIKRNWDLPRWLQNAKLSARVRVYIDAQGRVIKREISRSSNNQVFDERALNAVDKSSPLPAPPSDLTNVLAVDGIEIEFVPE
jgi:TonB family protein